MNNTRRRLLLDVFKLFDLVLMVSSFIAASLAVLSGTVTITEVFSMRVKVNNFVIFGFLLIVWHLLFSLYGLYSSRRLSSSRSEAVDVIKASSLGTFVILLGAVVFRIRLVTPPFLVVFWLISTGTTVSSRLVLRVILAWVRKRGRNLRDIIIVGTNDRALDFAHRLGSRPELGYRVVGFVDQEWQGMEAFRKSGYTLASDIESFLQFLRNSVVDEVMVALPFRSMHDQASRIATACAEQGITVRVLTNIFELKSGGSSPEELDEESIITHSTGWVEGWPLFAKRVLDIIISTTAIILLSPVLVAAGILVKLTSPGPVLFVQKRLGLNKRPFDLYKFRTMVMDAEERMRQVEHLNEVSGPVFKMKNDPRVTTIGRFLRKTSIDELPQLFNVLKSEMSLVGPRPLPARDYNGFDQDWPRRRFSVRPGVTCLWQIRGRSSIPFQQWMELDLQYIDKWSLWLDFQILMRTIPAVFKGSGAI